MFKRLLSIGLAASFGIAMLAGQAFANDNNHFGHVRGIIDTALDPDNTGARELTMSFEDCHGELHGFHFRQTSDLDDWSDKTNNYMLDNQFLNIGTDDTGMVTVMATMGGSCDNIDIILEALSEHETADSDDESDTDSHDDPYGESDIEAILEVYEHSEDLPEGHVLSEPPAGFEGDLDEIDHNLRRMLKHQLLEELKEDRELTRREIEALKKRSKKRVHINKYDEDVEELERGVGFEHINPLRIDHRPAHLDGKAVVLRGIYKAKEDVNGIEYHVLVNANREMLVKLDLQGEDYSEFVDKKVFVKGDGFRSEKRLVVDGMRELNRNESEHNNAEMQFRIGASLYHDIDTNDKEIWYAKYLGELFDDGVFTGYEDGSFGGANPVTLAEIAKVAAESAKHDVDMRVKENRLRSKYKGHWGKFYLKHAEDFNLLPEVDNPDRPATRVEVLEAILRAYEVDPSADLDLPEGFLDTDNKFILKAKKLGIVEGFDDGNFRPHAHTNRAEVAKMMTLAAELLGEVVPEGEVVDDIFEELEGLDADGLDEWLDSIEDEDDVETAQ